MSTRDAPGYLEVRACRVGAVLTVEVADDGRGMVPRIESPGLGLGLALIAQMADVFEIRTERKRPGLTLRMQFDLDGTAVAGADADGPFQVLAV